MGYLKVLSLYSQNVMAEWLALLLCMPEAIGSNLGPEISSYPD
jgi:hypothetical protein